MAEGLVFGSVCSGIEAASMAWEPLGWRCAFVSEIDPFACAVLAHRFPNTPNFGDFTQITRETLQRNGRYPSIDLLIGGTPCQSFSIAGLRAGIGSPNGNLALEFVKLLARLRPKWFIWENVPGALSSGGGSDLASILGGFTGQRIGVPAGGWRNSGIATGIPDAYDVAWRVLDARHFGVPQRRRRVFIVGCLAEVGRQLLPSVLRGGEDFNTWLQRFSLSRDACLGMLRRAERRGKRLPSLLESALMARVR